MNSEISPLIYFGKLPSRGDFVRARYNALEIDAIDDWISGALERSEKASPALPLIFFSHVNTLDKEVITGVILPSNDNNDRIYPIIGMQMQYIEKIKNWTKYLPVKSFSLWQTIETALSQAKEATTDYDAIERLNNTRLTIDDNAVTYYYDFINSITLNDIATKMVVNKVQLIEQIIATGLLFLPTLSKGFIGLNKTLCWSLGTNKNMAINMATFWHDLIHGFYTPHEIKINTYFYQSSENYLLTLSFNDPQTDVLAQLSYGTNNTLDSWVIMDNSNWTQNYVKEDIGLSRFYELLSQDQLYLYDIRQLFKQVFLAQ